MELKIDKTTKILLGAIALGLFLIMNLAFANDGISDRYDNDRDNDGISEPGSHANIIGAKIFKNKN